MLSFRTVGVCATCLKLNPGDADITIMNAYGYTSDMNSGVLRDSWACGSPTAAGVPQILPVKGGEESSNQYAIEFSPALEWNSVVESETPTTAESILRRPTPHS